MALALPGWGGDGSYPDRRAAAAEMGGAAACFPALALAPAAPAFAPVLAFVADSSQWRPRSTALASVNHHLVVAVGSLSSRHGLLLFLFRVLVLAVCVVCVSLNACYLSLYRLIGRRRTPASTNPCEHHGPPPGTCNVQIYLQRARLCRTLSRVAMFSEHAGAGSSASHRRARCDRGLLPHARWNGAESTPAPLFALFVPVNRV